MDDEATTDRFACTLDPSGAEQRLPQVRALIDRLRRRERLDGRLRLTFEDQAGTVELVEDFVDDEARCCSFFRFGIHHSDGEVVLELSAPPEAGHMLDAAMRSFDAPRDDEQALSIARWPGP